VRYVLRRDPEPKDDETLILRTFIATKQPISILDLLYAAKCLEPLN
jgi:hypothetical protein